MAKKNKYYVVWSGKKTGVFDSWKDCEQSVKGVEGAKYKSFDSLAEAEQAFNDSPNKFIGQKQKKTTVLQSSLTANLPIYESISTDAACSGNPGVMEYRGVYTKTGDTLFYYKHKRGTNNIGEFLGIVHGLSYLKKHNLPHPLYTDSKTAIAWVKQKKCKTKLPPDESNEDLFDYIHRAEQWLENNSYSTEILNGILNPGEKSQQTSDESSYSSIGSSSK
jgi:ribonuclease HI